MHWGNVVLINGPSSAGKSSIARELQRIMDEPYLHTGIDHFLAGIPGKFTTISDATDPATSDYFVLIYSGKVERATAENEGDEAAFGLGILQEVRLGPGAVALLSGMYQGIAALSVAGVNVIVDDVIYDRRVLSAAVRALQDCPVLFVGIRIPREIAEQRERDRGDRGPGGVDAFYDRVHVDAAYDLELDSSILSPADSASRIKAALDTGRPGTAARDLALRLLG